MGEAVSVAAYMAAALAIIAAMSGPLRGVSTAVGRYCAVSTAQGVAAVISQLHPGLTARVTLGRDCGTLSLYGTAIVARDRDSLVRVDTGVALPSIDLLPNQTYMFSELSGQVSVN